MSCHEAKLDIGDLPRLCLLDDSLPKKNTVPEALLQERSGGRSVVCAPSLGLAPRSHQRFELEVLSGLFAS